MTIMDRSRQVAGFAPSQALRMLPATLLVIDVVVLAATGVLAAIGRETLTVFNPSSGIAETLGAVGPLAVVAWVAVIAALGGYRRAAIGMGTDEFKCVLRASLLTAGLLGVGCYLAKYNFSRGFFLLAFLIGPALLVAARYTVRKALHSARRRGHIQARVLVAGSPEHIDEMTGVLRRENWLGYSVLGAVTPRDRLVEETSLGVPVLGKSEELVELARLHGADIVFLTGGSLASAQEMKELGWALEEHRINMVIAPSLNDISHERLTIRPVGGLPLIHVEHPRWASAGRFGKRLFDVVGSSLLIAMLAPVFLVAATQIWLHDRGAILFKQRRVGRHGEPFHCLKFRTMVTNAETMAQRLQAETSQSALLFKMKDDPRVTKPGRWLRRLSVDELPQLVNVLRGDMSLVGPRPQVEREVALYDGSMQRRLLVRPGMTGLWQVSGRNELTAEEAMRLDVYYVDNWSMVQDVAILFRTVTAVLSSRGAY